MPDHVTTVTPSVLNTPKPNGATSTQQPVTPKPNAAAPAAESPEVKLAAREAAFAKQQEAYRNELKKNAEEKKGLGAKLSELNELRKWKSEREQRDQLRKLNPVAALEEDFGKDWADKITNLRVNGVPPTDLVASVVQQLRAEFKADLEERDRKTAAASTAAEQSQVEEARAEVSQGASQWYEANAKEFPVFERLGDASRIGQILGDRIESEFKRSGKLLTAQQAAEMLEADMLSVVETAVKADKYKAKLQGETKPANVSPSSGASVDGAPGTPRRTLDNSMTASTSGRAPPKSDAEREQRAMEAFNAVRAGRKT